jgi:ABC-type branched-subunit amino acid transport system substrate-binding protein
MVGGPFNAGLRAYFHMVNEAGGVHGRRIEFVHHDDGFDPVTGLAFTEQLIHDDRVFAIVGHFGTPTIGATLDLLKQTGIPTVYFAAGIGALYNTSAHTPATGQGLFPVQPIFVTEGRVLVARVFDEYQVSNLGVIFSSDEAGHDLLQGIRYQAGAIGGITLREQAVTPGQPDVSSAVLSMIADGVDAVIVASLQPTFIIVLNAMAAAGLDVPVFTSYISADPIAITSTVEDYLGSGATFPVYSTAWLDIFANNGADAQAFIDGVTAYGDASLAVSAFAMAGWIAGSTFVQGLRATDPNDLTWEGFIAAMERTPISLPMAGTMIFANGIRTGTSDLALLRANFNTLEWETLRPLESLTSVMQRIQ